MHSAFSRPWLRTAFEFLLYAVFTALALYATWLTWPDAYIDFSRELYLPWRVSCGDVLYRDLAYDFGPISVYTNAAFFALLGHPSIHALFALNFAFWLATFLALRTLLRRMAHPAVATLAVSLFILLFSFNRYLGVGNYNFLAPYSHELPRGFLFFLLSLLALDSALAPSPRGLPATGRVGETSKRPLALLFISGLFLGLSLFTKPEIAIAAVSASAVLFLSRLFRAPPPSPQPPPLPPQAPSPRGLPATGRMGETPPNPLPSLILPLLLGILAALAVVLLPLSIALGSFFQALRNGLLNLYRACFDPILANLSFYREIMGIDDVPAHILRLLLGAILSAAPFILALLALPRISSRPLRIVGTALLVSASSAVGFFAFFPLNAALPIAPVLFAALSLRCPVFPSNAAGTGLLTCLTFSKPETTGIPPAFPLTPANHSPTHTRHSALSLAFATFAFLLSAKILLDAHIWHYGFVLALPAFCCAVLLLFRPPCPHAQAAVAVALLLGFSIAAFRMQSSNIRHLDITRPIHDATYRTSRFNADAFDTALEWIRTNTDHGSSLAVLPEGAILNVLSRRPNPTPYVYLSPGDCVRFGEAAILAAYSNAPPDTLVLVRKLEPGQFGIDYAQSLMDFLDPLYTPAHTLFLSTPSGSIPYLLIATRTPAPLPPPPYSGIAPEDSSPSTGNPPHGPLPSTSSRKPAETA